MVREFLVSILDFEDVCVDEGGGGEVDDEFGGETDDDEEEEDDDEDSTPPPFVVFGELDVTTLLNIVYNNTGCLYLIGEPKY